jgi:hypothetical protein
MEEDSFMASRDQDKPAANLLRRSLASSPGVEAVCPDPEILAAYLERSLDADETARFELHFSHCARCREQLSALSRSGELVGASEEKRPRTQRMPWIWDWRWLAPATAALVFVALLIALRPVRHPGEESLVAMDHQPAPPAAVYTPMPDSGPAARASAPHTTSAAGARISPPSSSAKSDVAPPVPSRELPETPAGQAATSPPLNGRNYKEILKLTMPAPAHGANPSAAGSSSLRGGTSQAATSPAASPPAAQAARVPADIVPPDVPTAGPAYAGAVGAPEATDEKKMAVMVRNPSSAQTESLMVEAGVQTSDLTLVRTPDPQVIWRFSSGRFIERSIDAGITWRVQWTKANAHLIAGAAPTADTCWLVGRDAMILLTTDGRKWKTISPPADADFVYVEAADAFSATVTTTDGRKFTTNDGGRHWTPAP